MKEALEKVRTESYDRAEKQVAGMLLIEAVGKVEKIEVSDSEVEARIQELSREHRIPVKQVRAQMAEEGRLDNLTIGKLIRNPGSHHTKIFANAGSDIDFFKRRSR